MEEDRLSYDNLHRLYVVEGLGVLAVARAVKCRNETVHRKLHEYGLVRAITREWLEQEHVAKERSVDDIAKELRLDESSVRYHLRKFGIPIRYKSRGSVRLPLLHDQAWMVKQYCEENKSIRQIADEAQCAVSSVVLALQRHNIVTRKPYGKIRRRHSYRFQFTPAQRRAIIERDENRCRFPICPGNCGRLDAHHIVPKHRGGTNAIGNGITLGRACHQLTYGKEDEYEQVFLALVQVPLT